MKKRMEAVEVFVNKDLQVIIQSDDVGGGPDLIVLAPEQVDTIIKWLEEARDEALAAKAE